VIIGNCRFADDVLYDTDSNTWMRLNADGSATVGINAILAWVGGPFASVSFKQIGAIIERGKSLGAVESPRYFDTIRSPITGKLIGINEALAGDPKLLNRDPYSRGWFAKLEPRNLVQEKGALKPAATAREGLQRKISELRVRCFAEFPDHEMFEIGTECSAVLVKLNELMSPAQSGTVVHLVSDDPTSELELIRWSGQTGNHLVEARKEGDLMHYIVKKA